jgi:hypothetical protein
MNRPGLIERAYELAKSGEYPTVTAIKNQIRAEGYPGVDGHLHGASIHSALRNLCLASRAKAPAASSARDN